MKDKYLKELKKYLENQNVTKEDIVEIIIDYNEFYEGYLDKGYENQEIKEKLGTPKKVYQSIKNTITKEPSQKNKSSRWVAIAPFIAVISFVILGYYFKTWHPTWLVFLIIPASGAFFSAGDIRKKIIRTIPFIALVTYFLIGHYLKTWHPTWLVFLLVPITTILLKEK